ncbi:MAG TPA: tyrosine--tRNA ligase [Candidatus Saccharimonadales bacterium]|nr:tyrosine--tRNA ligase [Candidatus Saccharimonadales bacterium]
MTIVTLSEELQWRGLIKDKTFSDNNWLDKPRVFYLGIDASSDSLTVGNLAIIILARRLADVGWKAVMVMGGGTSLVGDPGGKTEERQLMSRETIVNNIKGVKTQVTKLFSGEEYIMLDNYDWLAGLKYVDFLREVGKHFSMTELMHRDFVTERMGKGGAGISYAEFSYSLVQGYDFWHLYNKHNVTMQIGGSDQWGNLLSGVSLIRKKEGKEAHALSMPLIVNKTTGQKFGKSESGAIWLDEKKTSPHDFYQFWLSTDDDSVEDYLKIFTELNKVEIVKLMQEFKSDKKARIAQKNLAYKVTKLVHGQKATEQAEKAAEALSSSTETTGLKITNATADIVETLVKVGLASSKTEARQLLASGGVYINGKQTTKTAFETSDFQDGLLKLRRGKTLKNTVIVKQK